MRRAFLITSRQLPRMPDLKAKRTSFQCLRGVGVEVSTDSKLELFHGINNFLACIQLSLQALRIFFIVNDRQSKPTSIFGCGKRHEFTTPYDTLLILNQGQDSDYQ